MTANTVKFFYNGIKINGGKLIKGWFCHYKEIVTPTNEIIPEHVHFFAREYGDHGLQDVFAVRNDTDSMTDYFEKDRVRFEIDHPMFKLAKAAADKEEARAKARIAKRSARSPFGRVA